MEISTGAVFHFDLVASTRRFPGVIAKIDRWRSVGRPLAIDLQSVCNGSPGKSFMLSVAFISVTTLQTPVAVCGIMPGSAGESAQGQPVAAAPVPGLGPARIVNKLPAGRTVSGRVRRQPPPRQKSAPFGALCGAFLRPSGKLTNKLAKAINAPAPLAGSLRMTKPTFAGGQESHQ